MPKMLSPEKRAVVLVMGIAFVVAALLLTNLIPPVEGLGEKVRLPMFHGGSTWVNLATFTFAGIAGLSFLLTGRRGAYAWGAGFRWVSAPLWLINTALGVIAATQTWDFTGSKQSPLVVIQEDPRLMAQFILLLVVVALLIFDRLVETDGWRAFADLGFAALMWVLLWVRVFGNEAARALHPDNPVLNSAADIQLPFFAIVGSLALAAVMFAWLVADGVRRRD